MPAIAPPEEDVRSLLRWIMGEPRPEPGQDPADGRRIYWQTLDPRKDPLRFIKPGRCSGVWTEPGTGSSGCGHIVRLSYMTPTKRRRDLPVAYSAECPICGTSYPFHLVKLVLDGDYKPEREEAEDLRAMYADIKRISKGEGSTYDPPFEARVRVHCLTFRKDGNCDAHFYNRPPRETR